MEMNVLGLTPPLVCVRARTLQTRTSPTELPAASGSCRRPTASSPPRTRSSSTTGHVAIRSKPLPATVAVAGAVVLAVVAAEEAVRGRGGAPPIRPLATEGAVAAARVLPDTIGDGGFILYPFDSHLGQCSLCCRCSSPGRTAAILATGVIKKHCGMALVSPVYYCKRWPTKPGQVSRIIIVFVERSTAAESLVRYSPVSLLSRSSVAMRREAHCAAKSGSSVRIQGMHESVHKILHVAEFALPALDCTHVVVVVGLF